RSSRPKLLEPIMGVELVTEAELLGAIIGDVYRRRGTLSEQGQMGPQSFVQGQVPLSETFGYMNLLRSANRDRGPFTMEFDNYAEVPASLVEKLMEKESK